MLISRSYRFEAAHHLPKVAPSHKCSRVHGHNYRVEIGVFGPLDERGFVVDFAEIDARAAPLVARCDHRLLNEIIGLENPTAEIIAGWFYDRIRLELPVSYVRVFETDDCFAEFGEGDAWRGSGANDVDEKAKGS